MQYADELGILFAWQQIIPYFIIISFLDDVKHHNPTFLS